tara:strand:- start:609 stop:1739 length:1131 start_codon:yes stop_codon:yes gene_type:complete
MATEKNWDSRNINIQVSDTDEATTSGKYLFQWYTMLSGSGANGLISGSWGTATSPWTVISASNGTAVATTWDDYTDASSSATSGGSARSWVLFENSTMGHPTGSLWFCVDNVSAGANNLSVHMTFGHEIPTNFGSVSTTVAPAFTSNAYQTMAGAPGSKDVQVRPAYDAANPTYFHGTMNTTGSFIIVTGQNQNSATKYNYPHSTMITQLETPRSSSVDPYPYLIKSTWKNTTNGPYGHYSSVGNSTYTHWDDVLGGHAMWWKTGAIGASGDGFTPTFMAPGGSSTTIATPWYFSSPISQNLDYLDGTSPMLPTFVINWVVSYYSVRGRIADVMCGWGGGDAYGMEGMATPATGTPEYAFLGNYWLPFTGTLQPGQ